MKSSKRTDVLPGVVFGPYGLLQCNVTELTHLAESLLSLFPCVPNPTFFLHLHAVAGLEAAADLPYLRPASLLVVYAYRALIRSHAPPTPPARGGNFTGKERLPNGK